MSDSPDGISINIFWVPISDRPSKFRVSPGARGRKMAGREYREQADSPRRENDYDGTDKSRRSPCYRHLFNLQRIRNEDPGVLGIIVLKTTVTTGSFLKLIKQTVNVDDSVVYAAVSPLCVHAHIRSFDPQMVAFSETSTIFPLFLTNTRPLY